MERIDKFNIKHRTRVEVSISVDLYLREAYEAKTF